MLGLIAVNIFMYLQGRVFIRGFVNITRVPTSTLVPILVMLCVIGAYAIDYSVFNAIFMVGVGIFGYFMTKLDMPMTPMVIGLVLGKLCESNLRRALIVSKGSWATFFTSPSACSLFFCRCLCCSSPILRRSWRPAGLRLDQRRTYEKWEFDSALFRKILSRQRRPSHLGGDAVLLGGARWWWRMPPCGPRWRHVCSAAWSKAVWIQRSGSFPATAAPAMFEVRPRPDRHTGRSWWWAWAAAARWIRLK